MPGWGSFDLVQMKLPRSNLIALRTLFRGCFEVGSQAKMSNSKEGPDGDNYKKVKQNKDSLQAIVRKGRFRDKPLKRTFSLKRDAEIWAREQQHLIDMKRHQDPRLAEMVTLEHALKKYFQTIETPGPNYNEPTTVDRKRACALSLKRFLGEDISLAEISPRMMAEFRDHRLKEKKVSGSTVRQELSLISHLSTLLPCRNGNRR